MEKSSKKEIIKKEEKPKVQNIKFNIIAIICIIAFCASLAPKTLQNDTFYTIKIGSYLVDAKTIDMQEHFSWHEGLPYTYPHWLYDIMIYLFYYLGGMEGIFISTMIFSAILGIVMYFTNLKISKNNLMSFIITLITMYLLRDFIAARAQLVSFILLELIILFIEKFLEKKKKRYAVAIILISILIANVHAAIWPFIFILFLPYIGEYILNFNYMKLYYAVLNKIYKIRLKGFEKREEDRKPYKTIEKLKKRIEEIPEEKEKVLANLEKRRNNPYKLKMVKEPAVKWLILLMVILAFTGLLTPIGDTPYTWTYRTMKGTTTGSISEHLPLTLINNKPILITLAMLLAMLIFTDVKIRLRDLFFLTGLTVLMLMSRRQESMLLLFGSGAFARLVADIIEKYDKEGTKQFVKIATSILGTIATFLLIALMVILQIKNKKNDKFVNVNSYPVSAVKYIKENIDISSMRLYNEYNYGSYLLYKDIPVFIDSRADLYTPEFNKTKDNPDGRNIFSDYINASNISKYYEDIFKKYDITHIILYRNSKLATLLTNDNTGNYNKIYEDQTFYIFERNSVNEE